ncbi:hypothetical protein FOCC_FOCC004265, partial [Frankliniella occidentalis]
MKNLHTLLLNNNHLVRLQNGMFNGLSELRYIYLHYNELEKIAPDTFSAMPSLQRLFLHNNKLRTIPPSAFRNLQSLKRMDPAESDIRCFLAGDIRANEQVGLLAMHTIWFREHNRVAEELRKVNPHWDSDSLYHEARKIVGAEVQHITFKHWLPTVLGAKGMAMMGDYQGYDPNVNPGISNAFATAALRFGHSLINPQLHRLNESYMPIPEGHLPLGKAFFSPWRLVVEGGVDPLLRGFIHTPAKLKTPSQNLNAELTEQLFTVAHAVALDLAAINIQRGRDHGLPEYNAYREKCGLAAANTFDDLRHEISSQEIRDKLKEMFYYENPAVFKPEQLTQIKQTTLARVLCDNGDKITRLQRDVFYLEKTENLLSCDTWDIPRLEFRFWAECCQDCRSAGQFSSLGRTFYRGVRRYRRELNDPAHPQTPEWQNEDDDALNAALDLGLGLDDDLGEERIEGLETAIESFQKAVRQLRRKLRRLEGRCTRGQGGGRGHADRAEGGAGEAGCVEEAGGRRRDSGEQWLRDPCTQCSCKGQTIKCSPVTCPRLSCADTVTQPGECCPRLLVKYNIFRVCQTRCFQIMNSVGAWYTLPSLFPVHMLFRMIRKIRLDNNWLVCDCNALWLARLLRERGVQGAATCASPPQLQGRPVAELRESDFHCSKPRIVKEPDDVELDYVGPVYFKCQAEGDPQPRIVWLKEGQEEMNPGEPGYEFMSDGTLMVEAPSMDPVGAYACVAKSAMGEAKSRVARLVTNKRRERPDISRPPRDWQVAPGDTIATDGTLVLTGLRADEAGEYRCTASNAVGSTSASARVTINVAPRISSRPDNLTVKAGGTVLLRCRVDGSPRPSVAWFKDGRTVTAGSPRTTISNTGEELRVEHAKEADGGLYVCRAENAVGSAETMARVQVVGLGGLQQQGPRPRGRVRLVHHPFNMEAMVGTSVEIPCSAEADNGQPLLSWRKDGQSVTLGPRLRVGRVGSLRIYNVTLEDAGLYECIATDGAEEVSAKGLLAVRGDVPAPGSGPFAAPGDQFVRQAFGEASLAVDRAVNATLRAFQQAERNHATLYRAIRFPDASARDVARAADVFEKTLINIRRHVEAGSKMNVTQDFNYTELLSPKQLQLVANLSGCMAHRPTVDCSDMCFHLKYRTVDGTCNNLQHPMWGASLTGFRRVLRPQYENGLSTPIGWNKNVKYFGYPKPSARLVSTSIIKTEAITPDPSITHMVMQWGQFLDHDLDHAIPSETSTSWDGIDCKKSCDYAAPCYPIEVPPNDPRVNNRRCIDFIRSSAICGSGQTSVLFDGMQPREQINQLTSFVDASQVYGFSDEQARGLRNLTNEWGRLREGAAYQFSDKPYLPFPNPGEAMDCR